MTMIAQNVEIAIGKAHYGVEFLADAECGRTYRLTKDDGVTVYDVTQGEERTTCDCPDFVHRHAPLPYSEGCKHIKAMVEAGMIENVRPKPLATDEPDARPANLVEKYRPRTLADLVGQDEIVYQLREFLEAPVESAFIFEGSTGVGKTSAALAFAADLGCDVEQEELGGVYQIAAGDQVADTVRETLRSLRLRPLFGNGWKVLIVNEGDRMSESAAYVWLDALEALPPKTVVVFTTNHATKLPRRLMTRCERFRFRSSALLMTLAAQARVNEVWHRETGRTDAPRVDELDGAIEDGEISIRACLQALNPLVRRARREAGQPTRPQAVAVAPEPAPVDAIPAPADNAASGRDAIEWQAVAARYQSGVKLAALAHELGLPRQTVSGRLKRMGVK